MINVRINTGSNIEKEELKAYAENQISHAADHFRSKINEVRIRVFDRNGSIRGGFDKVALVTVSLNDGRVIRVHDEWCLAQELIDRVAAKLKRGLERTSRSFRERRKEWKGV